MLQKVKDFYANNKKLVLIVGGAIVVFIGFRLLKKK